MTSRRFQIKELTMLAAILLLAAVFRYWQIGQYPLALHFDELINGLIVQDLLRGKLPEMLTFYRARELMIFYVMAPAVYFFGPTPGALRFATASVSLALVGTNFLLARELLGRKMGVLLALITATTIWPIYHGRLATRSILVPLVMGIGLYFAVLAWRGRKKWQWALAGIFLGGVFYTYASNFFIIPTLILTVVGLFIFDRAAFMERKWELVGVGLVVIAVGLPILIFRAFNPPYEIGSPTILSVFYPGQSAFDFIKTVATQTVLVGRMFVLKGDYNIRHNIARRPVFDLLMALPFLVGVVLAWKRPTRRAAALYALWLFVWLVPTFLAKDAPHFLRASGALVSIFVWPALGLRELQSVIRRRAGAWVGLMVAAAVLGGSILITTHDYIFSNFLASPEVTEEFFGKEIVPILEFNRKYHVGWVGDNLFALPAPTTPTPEQLKEAADLPQPYAQYLDPWLFDPNWRQYPP